MTFFISQLLVFDTICACEYQRSHRLREGVPSHARPWGHWSMLVSGKLWLVYSKAKHQKLGANSEQHLYLQHAAGTLVLGWGSHLSCLLGCLSRQRAVAEALLACSSWKLVGVLGEVIPPSLGLLQKTKYLWFMMVYFWLSGNIEQAFLLAFLVQHPYCPSTYVKWSNWIPVFSAFKTDSEVLERL